jgi:hypothetical protein
MEKKMEGEFISTVIVILIVFNDFLKMCIKDFIEKFVGVFFFFTLKLRIKNGERLTFK